MPLTSAVWSSSAFLSAAFTALSWADFSSSASSASGVAMSLGVRGLRGFFSGLAAAVSAGGVGTNGVVMGLTGLASCVAAGMGLAAASFLMLALRSAMRFSSAASASLRLSAAAGFLGVVSAIEWLLEKAELRLSW